MLPKMIRRHGLDHVDGHRTVGMVISPYTKRGEVISTYYSQINMVRTIENILGITSDEPARSVCRSHG